MLIRHQKTSRPARTAISGSRGSKGAQEVCGNSLAAEVESGWRNSLSVCPSLDNLASSHTASINLDQNTDAVLTRESMYDCLQFGTEMANTPRRSTKPPSHKANKLSTDLRSDASKKRASGWIRQWRVPTLLRQISVRRNNLLRTTVARWCEKMKCLELGPKFFKMTGRQDEILCHELAHAAAVQIHGRGVSPHGPEWRALVAAAGFSPRSALKASKSSVQVSRGSSWYEHRCPVCHAVRFAKKPMMQWGCAECSQQGLASLLKITKLEERP